MEIHLPYKTEKDQLKDFLKDEYGVEVEIGKMVGTIDHVFSHLTWNIHVYEGDIDRT